MVVRKFPPYGNYRNGIIKNIYPTNESNEIALQYTNYDYHYSHIYPSAFLDDKETYFQSLSSQTELNMSFKRFVFLTYFGLMPRIVSSREWCFPKSIEIQACKNNDCFVLDSITKNDKYSAPKRLVLTPVNPGTFNNIKISMNASSCNFNVIERFEIFGYLCDSVEECKWRNIIAQNTCKTNHNFALSFASVILFMIQ